MGSREMYALQIEETPEDQSEWGLPPRSRAPAAGTGSTAIAEYESWYLQRDDC